MRRVARPPLASLRDAVDYVWSLHDGPGHVHERIVSTGTVETRAHASILGVHFKPGGAGALGLPPGDAALASGYFDQAHLCREWADLTGLAPSAVLGASRVRVKDRHLALVTSVQDDRAAPG